MTKDKDADCTNTGILIGGTSRNCLLVFRTMSLIDLRFLRFLLFLSD